MTVPRHQRFYVLTAWHHHLQGLSLSYKNTAAAQATSAYSHLIFPSFHVYISPLQNWMTCWLVLPACLGHSVKYSFFKHLTLPPQAYELQMCQQCTPWKDLCGTPLLPDLWVQCKPVITILQTWLSQLHFYRSCYPHIQVIISLLLSTVLKSRATFTFTPTISLFSLWCSGRSSSCFPWCLQFLLFLVRDKILCGNLVQWMMFCPRHRNTCNERICYRVIEKSYSTITVWLFL